MSCEIDGIEGSEDDYALYNPLLYPQTTIWNGRTIEKWETPANPFFQKDLPFPSFDASPLNRKVEQLFLDPKRDII